MLSFFCNYVYEKLFSKPSLGQKRKHDESYEYPPVKHMKLESTDTFNIKASSCEYINNMKRLEDFTDENECCIISKDCKKKWASPSIMARQSIHRSSYTFRSSPPLDKRKLEFNSNCQISKGSVSPPNDLCEIEVVKHVNKTSTHNSCKLAQKTKISNRIFSTYHPSISKQNSEKFRPPFQASLKRNLNFLQESYRLSEKIQYMQLLQQTTRLNSFLSPFTIQNINKKGRKSTVPLVDLTKERNVIINRSRENIPWTFKNSSNEIKRYVDSYCDNKDIPEVNTLQEMLKTHPVTEKSIIEEILFRYSSETAEKQRQAELEAAKLKILSATNRKAYNDALEEKLRQYMRITTPALEEIEPEKDKYVLPNLSKDQESRISSALIPSPGSEVLVEKFGLQIKRRDIQTLKGLNWLNDEVINFYMNLIMERGKQMNMPKVYAFNTFFYPKLISGGHSSLRRWTKKVDIFSHDMILVPVHLGMHWCMAVIDFRSKEVKYYDSMGSSNNQCLEALLSYLEAESLDKKGKTYSTNDWEQKNMDDIPQQMNGSDCGVFSCMFAEHLARDSPLVFSQDHMPYFRRKMALEIIEAKLLT